MKFLLLEDHPLFRQALKGIVARLDPAATVLECASFDEARPLLGDDLDLVLLDLRLSGLDGMKVLATLRAQFPALPVVVVSASEDRHDAQEALRLGALGFIPKASSAEVMEHALRVVLAGDAYLPSHLLQDGDSFAPAPAPPPRDAGLGLTERQQQVMQLMAQGQSNKQIARALNLTENTVKVHVTAILRELQVSSRAQAIVALFQRGTGPS
ncbi:LuxR C-terminal-related transcriptional regulator [Paracidovorax sp. MALMAid1276]|uniref:LuxR C-terminal-related transcriptional regulator n=1 Tax=Paracidovorax sp. MALMAid1276 TaxID=3411631 RepID=UPI003B9DA382